MHQSSSALPRESDLYGHATTFCAIVSRLEFVCWPTNKNVSEVVKMQKLAGFSTSDKKVPKKWSQKSQWPLAMIVSQCQQHERCAWPMQINQSINQPTSQSVSQSVSQLVSWASRVAVFTQRRLLVDSLARHPTPLPTYTPSFHLQLL